MKIDIQKVRNIGISAHIDSGKTTLTERILYYTKRIHTIHDVRGKDGIGATMDSMELERERGITIASAATYCEWLDHEINIIDTPGHVDFTIEVERSLRVLDGAILVLCAVGGVQSQSITVDQQMKRYNIPCIAFINKCDRSGANPEQVVIQLREKLGRNAVALQIPIGLETSFTGVVDLISMKAVYFDGMNGQDVRVEDIPPSMLEKAAAAREALIDAVSMYSDDLMVAALENRVTEEMLNAAVRKGTLGLKLTPVLLGSAYKNKGIQPLLDAVPRFLPAPSDMENRALDIDRDEESILLQSDPSKATVSLAFKLENGQYGQLTYIRVYQGEISKGDTLLNIRTGKKVKIGRLVRMHANHMLDIESIPSGQIGALFGIDCASGDTLVSPGTSLTMTSMYIPNPVISLAIFPEDKDAEIRMSKALNRFTKEDPTFRCSRSEGTGETIISGMGELHLDVYTERIRREYSAKVTTGAPMVAYMETITRKAEFNYTHKKQTGGAGQFGRVAGYMEPVSGEKFVFENKVVGGAIPAQFIAACEKGFRKCIEKGPMLQFPVHGVRVVINDGAYHMVDSSDNAFQAAARGAFQDGYLRAAPAILEPVMKVVVESPSEFQGLVMISLTQRRGMIICIHVLGTMCSVESHVPLAEMFGFSTVLRSLTQGKAQFTMEFYQYMKVPSGIAQEIIKNQALKAKKVA